VALKISRAVAPITSNEQMQNLRFNGDFAHKGRKQTQISKISTTSHDFKKKKKTLMRKLFC
jgi:hypothetical protein